MFLVESAMDHHPVHAYYQNANMISIIRNDVVLFNNSIIMAQKQKAGLSFESPATPKNQLKTIIFILDPNFRSGKYFKLINE